MNDNYREKLGIINEFYFLSDEQEEIQSKIFKLIESKKRKKVIIQISGEKGDGKTYLLNSILRNSNGFYKSLKNDKDIWSIKDVCFIDDYEVSDLSLFKKFRIIIFTTSKYAQLKIRYKNLFKFTLTHKYRLKYLNIKNLNILNKLRNLEDYSFSTLKLLNDQLENQLKTNNKINEQDRYLFYQKLFERIYGKENWNLIKNVIYNSKKIFPRIDMHFLPEEKKIEFISNEWIYKKRKYFYIKNDQILVLLLTREKNFIEELKKSKELPEICKKYIESKIFQKSIINFLSEKINRLDLLKNYNLYLSNLLELNNSSTKYISCSNITFDLNSILDIFNLFKNKKLTRKIGLIYIINNSDKIFSPWYFNDDELYFVKNKFTNLQKLIILSFQILYNENDNDFRLINHINFLRIYREMKAILDINKIDIGSFGYFYLSYLFNIIYIRNKKIKNYDAFKQIKSKVVELCHFNINNNLLFIKQLRSAKIKYSYLNHEFIIVDSFFYWFDKTNLLDNTSWKLSKLDNTVSYDAYKNDVLKIFNYIFFGIYLKITSKEEFTEWIKRNYKRIDTSQNLGIYENGIEKFYFDEYKTFRVIKNAIFMLDDYLSDSKKYGRAIKKKILIEEPDIWKKIKKQESKKDLSNIDNSEINDFIKNLIKQDKNKCYYPIYISIVYIEQKIDNSIQLKLDGYNKKDRLENRMDIGKYPLDYSLKNAKDYLIITWWNNFNDQGYIVLSCSKKQLNKKFIIVLASKYERLELIIKYELKKDNNIFDLIKIISKK